MIRKWFEQLKQNLKSTDKASDDHPQALSVSKPECRRIAAYALSDIGKKRSNNEDNFLLDESMNDSAADHCDGTLFLKSAENSWHLMGVFDGMGGGEAGELASDAGAKALQKAYCTIHTIQDKKIVDKSLRDAFLEANNVILDLQDQYRIFGTTGTVICTDGFDYKAYHLGDSRAYLFRDKELYQITTDQTVAQMKIEIGVYDENHPGAELEKHQLTEFIGRDQTRQYLHPVESAWNSIQPGDELLICSDGLYDMCPQDEIVSILARNSKIEQQAKALLQAAIEQGGEDNITCILIRFT